ncbi:ATP/GTP-binding protein [Blastococcus saxobsidens]|uniref:ATP/GTP-binding protein n=1 Tax=Blastococcus saxobsidens TaxID=138336 RepID=A0A6L9VZK7_9ACTN|nr:ATP/GTP-binding protein [Blastococcus saxobsidens]NEK85108.1 ATP/GTP-binding protein [Blastococcus saxobsidens]
MQLSAALEQHIAVFGESGSGKTVLLSSFYGATQEPQYLKDSLFHVVADDIGQGSRLHRNYLGMKSSARVPAANHFAATSYAFSVKLKPGPDAEAGPNALRLVWHDYPGEWFEQDVSGPEEGQRRVDTFRSLVRSDVALLLVDAQRLLDNAGEEERYLKSLFANLKNGLLSLRDDLLDDGKPLVEFPRIWVLALSKSDLLPDLDVFAFRDLLIEKASDDIGLLREVIADMVEGRAALSVGEDFALLSSARFEAGRIELTDRVGLDLILPLAAMLPLERHIDWAESQQLPAQVAENLLGGITPVVDVLFKRLSGLPGPLGYFFGAAGPSLQLVAGMAGDALKEMNEKARAKGENLKATLTGFRLDLDRGEEQKIFLRSLR